VSRLQGVCSTTGQALLMARRFAELLPAGTGRPVGRTSSRASPSRSICTRYPTITEPAKAWGWSPNKGQIRSMVAEGYANAAGMARVRASSTRLAIGATHDPDARDDLHTQAQDVQYGRGTHADE